MKSFVIDVSMAANWVLEDEQNTAASLILSECLGRSLITTTVFWHEMRSILLKAEKRGRLSENDSNRVINRLWLLKIKEVPMHDNALILSLARAHGLSAYDAAYLALAMRSGAVLATNDKQLARAAINADVELRTALTPLQM